MSWHQGKACNGKTRSEQIFCRSFAASPYTWTCQSRDVSGAKLSASPIFTHGSRSPPWTKPVRPSFLLGDAAHIHSPVGGQGMNTGIGGAVNLAWKLAWVLQGRADDSILESYEPERIAFAQRLVKTTDQAFTAVTSSRPIARFVRLDLVPALLQQRGNAKSEADNRQRDAGRYRKESINTARAPDGERQIARRRNQRNQNHQRLAGHGAFATAGAARAAM